eukprot:2346542-Amphidinium_carterae.1
MPEACGGRLSIPHSGAAQLGATQQVCPEAFHRPAHLDVDMGLYLPSGAGVCAEAGAQPPMFMGQVFPQSCDRQAFSGNVGGPHPATFPQARTSAHPPSGLPQGPIFEMAPPEPRERDMTSAPPMGIPSVRTVPDPFDYMSQPAPQMGLPPVRPAQDPFDYRIPPPPSHQPPLQVQNNWHDCNLCAGA